MKEDMFKKIEGLMSDSKSFDAIKKIIADSEKKDKDTSAQKELLLSYTKRIGKIASFDFDMITNKVEWSDEIYEILERRPDEFDHTADVFSKFIHPDDKENSKLQMQMAIQNKVPYYLEYRLIMMKSQ